MTLDLLYTLTVLSPSIFKNDQKLKDLINILKSDKIKKVRDAAILLNSILDDLSKRNGLSLNI
jgi:hypothetical protein